MKILTTLFLLLIGFSAFAQSVSLTIFNNNGQPFFVIMNGIRQNSLPQTNVKIGGMTTGAYEVKLIFADGKTGDINKKIFFESGGDYLARVDIKGKKRKLRYFGMSDGSQPAPGSTIEYRPDDQSVYSDQPVQNTPPAGGTMPPPAGSTYGQPQNGTTVTPPAQTSGTVSGSTTVTPPAGSVAGSTTVTTPGTPGGTVSVNTTTIDPVTGQPVGGTTTIVVQEPASTGAVDPTKPPTPASNQQATTFGSTVTIPDPNIPTGFGVHINIDGAPPTTVVEGSSTSNSTTTATITENGQTTTTVTHNGQTTTTTTGVPTGTSETVKTTPSETSTTAPYTLPFSGSTICTEILADQDRFVNDLSNQDFDADKVEMIELHLKNACVTADQAYRIVSTLTFDADKLSIAKFLYVHMTDKNNGSRLLELFTFDADKQELRKFMATH